MRRGEESGGSDGDVGSIEGGLGELAGRDVEQATGVTMVVELNRTTGWSEDGPDVVVGVIGEVAPGAAVLGLVE